MMEIDNRRTPLAGAQNVPHVRRVPAEVYPYRAGIFGGFLGGIGMIPVAIAYGLMTGNGIWYPVNLIAATVLRNWQSARLDQLVEFDILGLFIGLALHMMVALTLGLIFAVVLPTLPGKPIYWAFIVGPILWVGAIAAGLPLLNPVMARLVDWPSFALANIIYSLILGTWVANTSKVPAE